ncbi:MAG: uracil-DNA glycosylase family protein [Thermoanaerobaculales bacterium]
MRPRELGRYLQDLGWCRAPVPPDAPRKSLDDLVALAASVEGCSRCRLSEQRRTVVFGEGHPNALLMFIGEGPGVEEDRTGRPFVGQAGQLLDEMIFAMGFDRAQVYIANVVKCRPPGNRDPQEDEIEACSAFLDRQVGLIAPRVIVALGKPASQRLTGTNKSMGAMRGRWSSYRGTPLMPIFHPAYLLRTPTAKREVWKDLKQVMQKLEARA